MSRLQTVLRSLRTQPGYTLMRGIARFRTIRQAVSYTRGQLHSKGSSRLLEQCEQKKHQSKFLAVDAASFAQQLNANDAAFGLTLPSTTIAAILTWADQQPCYADREPSLGFRLDRRQAAEEKLGKPILLAQYFNTTTQCPEIEQLTKDPVLLAIAAHYLCSVPTFVGANLWWTFPVQATSADRHRHAHLFHRDVDDFRFLKFFFYLTDVQAGEGAHVFVMASHQTPPKIHLADQWNLRRFTDEEIANFYPSSHIREICGAAGTGFAEDTLCIHKGSTPVRQARLLLQLQYALYDYGAMHDQRESTQLNSFV
jgi:hypothetical protein